MCLSLLTILMCRVFAAAFYDHLQGSAEEKTQSSSSKILSYEGRRSALKFEAQRVHNKKKNIYNALVNLPTLLLCRPLSKSTGASSESDTGVTAVQSNVGARLLTTAL